MAAGARVAEEVHAFLTERPFERDLAKDIEEKIVLMKELGLA